MALYTDPDVITLDDLLQFEAGLVQISSSHNIDVQTKISLAIAAIADRLMVWLLDIGGSDPQWLSRRSLGLSTIVVTSPLQRWLCFDSLSRFFAEAYSVQLNTRFQAKWTEYQKEAQTAAEMVMMSGLGLVYNPLAKPLLPVVTITPGSLTPRPLFIRTAWTDKFHAESALSPIAAVLLNTTSEISVSNDAAAVIPPTAVGWNVYVGTSAEAISRQNVEPLPLSSIWSDSGPALSNGPAPLDGQQPDFYVTLSRQILRG
jgi:hypothetical protein